MKRGTKLLLSVASGVLAVLIALAYGSSVRAEAADAQREVLAAYGGELVSVCVASRDIDPGEVLDETCVHMEDWVAGLLPDGAATSLSDVTGEYVTSSIPAGAVVCPVYLEVRDGAIEVPRGMVAVSVPASDESAVGGALAPGDRVDVYVSRDGVTDRLCRASVIDTSARGQEGAGAIAWVPLAVDPERVTEVLAATARGSVSLTLPDASLDAADAADGDGDADDSAAEDGATAAAPSIEDAHEGAA